MRFFPVAAQRQKLCRYPLSPRNTRNELRRNENLAIPKQVKIRLLDYGCGTRYLQFVNHF